MSTFQPLYLAELTGEHEGQTVTVGQAIEIARAGEGIKESMVRMITEAPGYRGAYQLTAFTKKRFGDPESSPEAKAMSQAWDTNKLVCFGHYLTEAERDYVADYDKDAAKIKATYAKPIVDGIYKGDLTDNEVKGLRIPEHFIAMPKRKERANAIKGKLSSFMDKLRKALEDHDKAHSGEGQTVTKAKATDEEFHAKHAYAMLARDQKAEASKLTATERKVLNALLVRMGKADKEAAKLVTKLGNTSE